MRTYHCDFTVVGVGPVKLVNSSELTQDRDALTHEKQLSQLP